MTIQWPTMTEDEDYDASLYDDPDNVIVELPKGTIEKLVGRKITWFVGIIEF